jgi:uncharacterized membrane protein (UPF0127 family)
MIKTIEYNSKFITGDMIIANSFIKRFLGYMFRTKPHHAAIMITPCNSIHTFFMKFEIDVIFLNEENKVIKKISRLKPRKIILPIKDTKYIIEGEKGIFECVKEGDVVSII